MAVRVDGNEGTIRFEIPNFETLNKMRMNDEPAIGANYWSLSAFAGNKDNVKWLGIRLKCNPGFYSNLWACDANVRISLINKYPEKTCTKEISYRFKYLKSVITIDQLEKFHHVSNIENGFLSGGTVVVEVTIQVQKNYGQSMVIRNTFSEPKEHMTDVVLIVEGKKIYVAKQYLAMHSKFFHSLFFPNLPEQCKEEIELDDVKYDEFLDLLNMVYPSTQTFEKENILHILKLARRFEVWFVVDNCEKFLWFTKMPEIDQLIIAEQFNLANLQFKALSDLNTLESIAALVDHPRYEEIGPMTMKMLYKKFNQMRCPQLFPRDEDDDSEEPPVAPIPQQ